MAPMPIWVIESAFAVATEFGIIVNFVKLPIFQRLGIT